MLEMDEGDAEEMEPGAPTNRAYLSHLRSTATLGKLTYYRRRRNSDETHCPLYAGICADAHRTASQMRAAQALWKVSLQAPLRAT